jgi:hypothetical protein
VRDQVHPKGDGRALSLARLMRVLLPGVLVLTSAACTASASTQQPASPSPVATPAVVGSSAPSPAASPAASPSPSPQPSTPGQTAQQAHVIIHELVLDPVTDPAAVARTVRFTSDGAGQLSVQVTSTTTLSNAKLCLAAGTAAPICRTGVAPGFADRVTADAHTPWTVTLTSADESTPTVDLSIDWPTDAASITLTDGRFEGTPNTDALRSFSATFAPRSTGNAALEASWKPGPAAATLVLAKEQTPDGAAVDQVDYPKGTSVSPAWSHAVEKETAYRVTLTNTSAATGRTSLSVTLSFP